MVVAGREQAQVVARGDGGRVLGHAVADGSSVLGDGGLLDVVATLRTDQEAFVAEDGVEVGRRTVQEVEEGAGVQVGLLEVQVKLGALGLLGGLVLGEDLRLEALGDVLVELEFGVEGVGGGPGLGEGETGRLVDILGLELLNLLGLISGPYAARTEPAMGPSWADLPFTLKVTPLGALDLTSRLAGNVRSSQQYSE